MTLSRLEERLADLKRLAAADAIDLSDAIAGIERKIAAARGERACWERIELARHPERPGAVEYVKLIADEFIELAGDRLYGDDPAVIGGIARIADRFVTVIGHRKGRNLKENIRCNHGMPHPEGNRKALRLARDAARFGRPILTLIDTAGAFPGIGAEERGIGQSIARNLAEFLSFPVPVVSVVVGEGGSGGALGIGVADRVYMLENAYYPVLSPEGFASLVLHDAAKAREAAEMMRISADDLASFKMIDGILPEPDGGSHRDPGAMAGKLRDTVLSAFAELERIDPVDLIAGRRRRFTSFGAFAENPGLSVTE